MSKASQQPAAAKRSATQRIEDLEKVVSTLYGTADNMARDLIAVKEAVQLLGSKVDALVTAVSSKEDVSDKVIARIMTDNKVEVLKGKVKNLVDQNIFVATESLDENGFVVGREIGVDTDDVTNPRLQFPIATASALVKEKLKGAKPGDVVVIEQGKFRFEVLETYKVNVPKSEAPIAPREDAPKA